MKADVLRFFHPVLPTAKLRMQPVRIDVANHRYVLFRDAEGRAAALDDLCPHRRAPLSKGRVRKDGRLACAYHGWNFDREGQGRSPSNPGLKRCDTRSYQVVERLGFLWLANHGVELSSVPKLEWEGFDFAGFVSTRFPASMELTLDNVTEDEHFAFIHSTFGWGEAQAGSVRVETERFDDHSRMRIEGPQRKSIWTPLGGLKPGDVFHNEWTTHFDPVLTIYTFGWRDPNTGADRPVTTRAAVFLVPESETGTWAHMFIFSKIGPSFLRRTPWLVHWAARTIARRELLRDAEFIRHIADLPSTLKGMRLTRWDHALAHNRKLLRTQYWGEVAPRAEEECE